VGFHLTSHKCTKLTISKIEYTDTLFALDYLTTSTLTIRTQRIYNVITMKASLVPIGHSKGIRIPKVMLEESGIVKDVEIKASKGVIKIVPFRPLTKKSTSETAFLSESVLRRDWDRPEEDKAWASL
jgi:antitoxin component of MazEF toxin-antitoxin module